MWTNLKWPQRDISETKKTEYGGVASDQVGECNNSEMSTDGYKTKRLEIETTQNRKRHDAQR